MSAERGPVDPSEVRGNVRRTVRAARRSIEPSERVRLSALLCAHIASTSQWSASAMILLYVPVASEVDVWPLVALAHAQGRDVAIPRIVDSAAGLMTFDRLPRVRGDSATDMRAYDFVDGAFGIPQTRTVDEVTADCVDLVLVPATALDGDGNRLGGGAGYYDRWLERARRSASPPRALGVVFSAQVLPVGSFPAEPHDQPVDAYVTEHGVTTCREDWLGDTHILGP